MVDGAFTVPAANILTPEVQGPRRWDAYVKCRISGLIPDLPNQSLNFNQIPQGTRMDTGVLLISVPEIQGHTWLACRAALNRWRAPVSGRKATHPWKEPEVIAPGVIWKLDQEVGDEDLSRLFTEHL